MAILAFLGRIILGLYFVRAGWHHLVDVERMKGFAAMKKVPWPGGGVVLSGLMLLFGGLTLLAGTWLAAGGIVLTVALVVITVMVHNYWTEEDPQRRAADETHFGKNAALIGASLLLTSLAPTIWWIHL
jgi:putative oxidoreductase